MPVIKETPPISNHSRVKAHVREQQDQQLFKNRYVEVGKYKGTRPVSILSAHDSFVSHPKTLFQRNSVNVPPKHSKSGTVSPQLAQQEIHVKERLFNSLEQFAKHTQGTRGSPQKSKTETAGPNYKKFRDELFNADREDLKSGKAEQFFTGVKSLFSSDNVKIRLDADLAAKKVLSKLAKSEFQPEAFLQNLYQSVKLLEANEFLGDAVNKSDLKHIKLIYQQVNTPEFVNLHEAVAWLSKDASDTMSPTWEKMDQAMTTISQNAEYNLSLVEPNIKKHQLAKYKSIESAKDVQPENVKALRDLPEWIGRYESKFEELYGDRLREKRFEIVRERQRSGTTTPKSSSSRSEW